MTRGLQERGNRHQPGDPTWTNIAGHCAMAVGLLLFAGTVSFVPGAWGSHQGHESHAVDPAHQTMGTGHSIPGASFQVFLARGKQTAINGGLDPADADAVLQTVIDAFRFMLEHRADYPRFEESLKKDALEQVVIEPTVLNREGKAFSFLVARTNDPSRVKLLISASALREQGYVGHADKLVPALAREFQWVVGKADTSPKAKQIAVERDLTRVPIRTAKEIRQMTGEERMRVLQQIFATYLRTVDDRGSLEGQSFYEVGTHVLVPPAQPDSTMKLYDIRIRDALQKIVWDPYFEEHTPKAVRSLLNGTIWNVAFVKIDQRDWATRTRVLPEDKAVSLGEQGRLVQPASILVNTYRTAAPDDPFYAETKGLPMGALSTEQLARVIALEIEHNIVEKSMKGHVAQDELSAPK